MRSVQFGCKDPDHGHELIINRRQIDTDHPALTEVLISVWRCNVLHTGGVLMEFPGPGS